MTEWVRLKVGETVAPTDLDKTLKVQHSRNVVGSFYEALASLMFGAERWEGQEIYAYEEDRDYSGPVDPDADPPCLIPDLLRRGDSTFIEVKGGNAKSQFKIYRWQAQLYDRIRRHGSYPIYRPRVEYAIFMHSLQRITKRLKTPRRLIEALAGSTLCCVLLDLDLVLGFDRWCGTAEYTGETRRQQYPTFYTMSSRHMNLMMEDPAAVLEELGLPRRRFSITRRTYGEVDYPLFQRILVGEQPLTPFPVVSIRHKRHKRPCYTGPVDMSWISHVKQEDLFPGSEPPDMLNDLTGEPDVRGWREEEVPF